MKLRSIVTITLLAVSVSCEARADLLSKAARETAEFVMKKFGKKAVSEGGEALAGKLATAAARHGDDVFNVVRKVGPKALGLADEAGANAPRVLKFLGRYGDDGMRVLESRQGLALFTRYGDDAGKAILKHQGVAEPLIEKLGQPAIRALEAVGPQNGRRLAMMASETSPELLGVIGKYGDPAMEFIWRHKGALAGSAMLAGFVANPEPYLKGTNVFVETVADAVVKPTVETAGAVAKEAATFLRWILTIGVAVLAVVLLWFVKHFRKPWIRCLLRIFGNPLTR